MNAKDKNGWTPLIYAAYEGRTDVVKLLISKGAAVNARSIFGNSALTKAKQKGHTGIVRLLEKAGAE